MNRRKIKIVLIMLISMFCIGFLTNFSQAETTSSTNSTNTGESGVITNPEDDNVSSGENDDSVSEDNTTSSDNITPEENPNINLPSDNPNSENYQPVQKPEQTAPVVSEDKKSSNANLSNLGIRPNDFSGFKSGTTSYDVTVPNDVETIEVYATAQDSKSKISGIGSKQLEEGKNEFSVVVTAEDGTQKTYTINVSREEKEEEETDETILKGLSELKIENLKLTPEFKADIYEYKVDYIGEETKLKIDTVATDEKYVVEVTGNEELKDGENIITILVSDEEGNNVATYQITVNKSLVKEEQPEPMILESQNNNKTKLIVVGVILAVIIVAIIIFFVIKYKRNENWQEEYTMPFSTLDYDNNQLEDFDENMNYMAQEDQYYDDYDYDYEEEMLQENDRDSLKQEYLNNYNLDEDEYDEWEEDIPRKTRHKGKRFK